MGPTVSVHRDTLFKDLGQEYDEDAFQNLCFDFGIELDDVVEEEGETIFKIDIPANRYDLLCIQGISQALNTFRQKEKEPIFKKIQGTEKIIVKKSAEQIRPYVVGAVLRNVNFTESTYNDFIDLQDKLHQNICRWRKYASIGTHDLDTIKGPFVYEALPPKDIEFVALKQTKKMNSAELLNLYESDMFFKKYIGLIKESPVYPVIKDSNGTICSLPPIVNGEHSKITLNTKNGLIEVTALDLTKARVVLDTVVTMFSRYCKQKFTCESLKVEYEIDSSRNAVFPDLEYRKTSVSTNYINNRLGVDQTSEDIAKSLSKMGLSAKPDGTDTISVTVPPTRHDVLQACDIMEDAGIAFDFNKLPKKLPQTLTIGKQQQLEKLRNLLREDIAAAGYTEALTFALCSRDDVSKKLRREMPENCVHIGNPKTLEFQVCRTTLIPGLLKTVANNRSLPLPIKVFEIQEVVEKVDSEIGAINKRKICAVHYNTNSGFENIVGLADRLMQLLEIRNYKLKESNDPIFLPKRSCDLVIGDGELVVGKIGVLHPEVVTNFDLQCPCSLLEIDLEIFETL